MYYLKNTSPFINCLITLLCLGSVPSAFAISVDKPVNFKDHPVGLYRAQDFEKDWGMKPNVSSGQPKGRLSIVTDPIQGKVLQVTYLAGKIGGSSGMTFTPTIFTPTIKARDGSAAGSVKYRRLFFQYQVKFPEDFTWEKGGKLPGLSSSPDSPTGCIANNTFDGFSTRLMWRKRSGRIVLVNYVYNPGKKERCGDYYDFNTPITLKDDTWYTLTQEVYLNTPGLSDGYLKQWVNGTLVLELKGMKLRKSETIHIDQIKMDTFFGGGNDSWAPKTDQHAFFANFIVSETSPLHEA